MKFHDELNPKLWNKDENKGETSYSLKSEVADKLMEIASFFIESNNINEDAIEDIRLLGSSANFNYNKYSDIDLHLVVDFDKLHEDCPIVNDYAWAIKQIFNQEHDISIYGVPVEIYLEPIDQPANSNGVYSLIDQDWIKKPEKIEPTDNDVAVQAKYEEIAQAIDKIEDSEYADELLDKIYVMRKSGLADGGEFSTENMAFKLLRNGGYLDKLREMKKANIDKELTLEKYEVSENLIDGLKAQYPKANIEVGHGAIEVKDKDGEIIVCGDYSVVAKFLADNKNRFENYIGEKQTMRKTISERESWEPSVSKIGRNQYAIFATETGGAVKYVKSLADAFDWIEKNWDIPRNEVKVNENYKGTKTMRKTISEERVEPSEIYDLAVANLPAEDIDHHASDLYIRKTPESEALIKQMGDQAMLSTFVDNIDGDVWYDLPFCYKPYWTKNESKINEEKYLSDEDIAGQYSDFKCTYIEVEPSKVNQGWFNFTLELEFPNADNPDFNDYVIENGYYNSEDDTWGFDNWYPEETSEKLKELVLAEIEKASPQGEDSEIEALQRLGSKGEAIYRNNKTGEFFVDKIDAENPKPAYNMTFDSGENLMAWASRMGLDESLKSVNEGNFEQQSTAWYDFCAYVKQIMSEGHDFDEAVYEAIDDTVYGADVINIWTNLPGNLGSRENEIVDLMREDIQEACYEEQEYIEGLDESLEVNEISDELKDKVTDARKKELKNTDRAFVAARNKAWKDTEGMEPEARKEAIMNNKKLDRAEDRANKAARKLVNNRMLRKAQSESLADSILKEAHEVLSMNESADSTTWSFKANGFSRAMTEKQNVFGNSEVRCVITENANGKLEGTATVNYFMTKEQVEETIKNALRENGFRTTVISELVNLY